MEDYKKKYFKYKGKYLNLKGKLSMVPIPITNSSVVNPIAPIIPNPISNSPIIKRTI